MRVVQPNNLFGRSQSSDASSSTSLSLPSVSFVCPSAPLAMCLCALVSDLCLLWRNRISLCHVTAVSLFCPLLSRLAGSGPEGSDGSAVKEDGSVVAWCACAS